MKVKDLVKDLVDEINSLAGALSLANYREESVKKENESLKAKIKELEKKIDELEF